MKILPDTNVAIEVAKNDADFEGLQTLLTSSKGNLVLAPPVIHELLVKVLNGQDQYFHQNRRPLTRLLGLKADILESPEPFAQIMFFGRGIFIDGVRPWNYRGLLSALGPANSKRDFIERAHDPTIQWNRIENLPKIHNEMVARELSDLRRLALQRSKKSFAERVAAHLTTRLITNLVSAASIGVAPVDPDRVGQAFSAAFEYLEANILKVEAGAKPEKNDRGVWVDYNNLWYLADPKVTIITLEKFHRSIKLSPQASRIIRPPWRT